MKKWKLGDERAGIKAQSKAKQSKRKSTCSHTQNTGMIEPTDKDVFCLRLLDTEYEKKKEIKATTGKKAKQTVAWHGRKQQRPAPRKPLYFGEKTK